MTAQKTGTAVMTQMKTKKFNSKKPGLSGEVCCRGNVYLQQKARFIWGSLLWGQRLPTAKSPVYLGKLVVGATFTVAQPLRQRHGFCRCPVKFEGGSKPRPYGNNFN